jgi:hypothetical protein
LGNKKTDFWETKYAEFGKQKLLNLGNEKGWLWETKRLTLGNKIAAKIVGQVRGNRNIFNCGLSMFVSQIQFILFFKFSSYCFPNSTYFVSQSQPFCFPKSDFLFLWQGRSSKEKQSIFNFGITL